MLLSAVHQHESAVGVNAPSLVNPPPTPLVGRRAPDLHTVRACCELRASTVSDLRPYVTIDHGTPVSSVHGMLQARILEWVAMPSSRGSVRHKDRSRIS